MAVKRYFELIFKPFHSDCLGMHSMRRFCYEYVFYLFF